MKSYFSRATIVALAIALAACSGGGGGSSSPVSSTPAPTPVVVAPAPAPTPVAAPIAVQATSYLNAKNINQESQRLPNIWSGTGPLEAITAGVAFADFFQDGKESMVAFSNVFAGAGGFGSTVAGKVYFFEKNAAGTWEDKTSILLSDRTGCISPRKVIVADFNGDGKPDVFAACHGIDGNIPTGYQAGEHPRFLLSQPNGTYKNVDADFNCYCHGAAAAEFNTHGYADIIVTDPLVEKQPFMLVNNKDGTFTKDTNAFGTETKAFSFQGQTQQYGRGIFSVELIDLNNDGKPDVIFGGAEGSVCGDNCKLSQMYYVYDVNKKFNTDVHYLPVANDQVYSSVSDAAMVNCQLVLIRSTSDMKSFETQMIDLTSNASTFTKFDGLAWTPWITIANGQVLPLNTIGSYDDFSKK